MRDQQRGDRERPSGRRITDHLRLIVAVPLVAVVGFAGLALSTTIQGAARASQLYELTVLAADAGALSRALQGERATAAGVLVAGDARSGSGGSAGPSGSAGPQAPLDRFSQSVSATDAVVRAYREHRISVADDQAGTPELMRRIDAGLDALPDLRKHVRTSSQATVSAVASSYRTLIADLISYREAVARGGAPTGIADNIRAATALSQAAEAIGQQQVAVLRAVAPGQLTPALRQEIAATRTSFTESTVHFANLAKPDWRAWYEKANAGAEVLAAQRMQEDVARTQLAAVQMDTASWIAAMTGWAARLFDVQQRIDRAVIDEVVGVRDKQVLRTDIEVGGIALALVVVIVLTSVMARRITRRLRRLHDDARMVAYERLPAVVAQLRAAPSGTVRPDEVADSCAAEVVADGSDEIAEVAKAFRAVHREAVRIAGEQAAVRTDAAEIFVHLSRREQRLVDAVLAQVDRVKRDETDPDRLQQLHQLDHLAIRMARINLSLLVLGGSGAARVRHEDAALVKVLQDAISQIEHHTRVRVGSVVDDVAVAAEAVDEVVHLLAELLDNATGYSPPDCEVRVTGRTLGDRVIIQISDEGVGLPQRRCEQLNQLLSTPPAVDVATVRSMGLTVVGHIAARYGIHVELRPSQGAGTIAEIMLPESVFRPIVAGDRRSPVVPALQGNGQAVTGQPVLARALFQPVARSAEPELLAPAAGAGVPPGAHAELADPVAAGGPADDTTVLLIFEEVNGWFRAENPLGMDPEEPVNWESSADEGWRVAAQAATPAVSTTTASGLPVRDPQRHLVPGTAPRAERPAGATKRDPTAIAAVMSAYARGVAGRRTPTQ